MNIVVRDTQERALLEFYAHFPQFQKSDQGEAAWYAGQKRPWAEVLEQAVLSLNLSTVSY